MKKLIVTGLLVGAVFSAFTQGQVTLRNILNSDTSPTAAANGLFFLDPDKYGPLFPTLITSDFSAIFYGGPNAGSLQLLASFTGLNTVGVNAAGPGTFFSSTVATIPGVPSGIATMKVEVWVGPETTFAEADAALRLVGTLTFQNPVGNPLATPPDVPPDLTGMGAVILTRIPEPSTFGFVGLGAAALFILRRRK